MRQQTHRWRFVSLVALTFLCGSCTFPSVEYEEQCMVPSACSTEVDVCRKQADAQQMMCLSKCAMTSCDACSTEFNAALEMCVAQCESCSASNGCMNATDNCRALLGAP